MTYYFAKRPDLPFAATIERTRNVLEDAGFGVITESDVTETLKQKLGVTFRRSTGRRETVRWRRIRGGRPLPLT